MYDLLVIGGGPSGLATAIHAAQRGMRTAIAEPRSGVIDKACGEGLMPGAWRDLQSMGVQIRRTHPFAGITYRWGTRSVRGSFSSGTGKGVRRLELHRALRDRADALGVDRIDTRVDGLEQHEDHVRVGGVRASWVAAADGLNSPTRHRLGLDRPSRWPRRYGIRRHFAVRPWCNDVEVHWAEDAEAYVTPVDDDLVGIAFLYGDAARRRDAGSALRPFDRLLARFPELKERLHTPASTPRGAGPFARNASARVAGRVLLVGDAAGYLDPLTGEGIKLGLRGAQAAVDAIEQGAPQSYETAWRAIYRPYLFATGALLLATRWTWTRRLVVPVAGLGIMDTAVRILEH